MHKPIAWLNTAALLLVLVSGLGADVANAADAATATRPDHRGSLPLESLDRHDEIMTRKEHLIKTGGTQLVFMGDSITDFWRQDPQREIFEDYFGQYRPYNVGLSFAQTQNALWRVEHGEVDGIAPKAAVIMIGTNNLGDSHMSPEETAEGISTLVTAVRQKLPNAKILLLGIFPRGNRPDDPFRVSIAKTNAMIAKLDDGRHVKYLDIGGYFLEPDGSLSGSVMPDYLHPNSRGYEIWAEAIKPAIDALEQ